jgi:tripartite-type tricarboxylate transporter receptor subunit TctC
MIDRRAFNLLLASAAAARAFAARRAGAAAYPERPVSITMQAPPGGGPDVIARLVADGLSRHWRQQVVIVNRPGGGGVIALQSALTAQPDGYALFMGLTSTFVVLPETHPELGARLRSGLEPVGLIGEQPMVVAVNARLGIASLQELVRHAKAHPGALLYGTAKGSLPNLTGELLQRKAGIKLTYVPYQSLAKATQDGASGTTQVVIESLPALAPFIQAGTLKPLAIAAATRVPDYPALPTVAEALPDIGAFESSGWFALMAPAGTPQSVIAQLGADLRDVLSEGNLRQKFAALGTYPRPSDAAEARRFIADEQALWKPSVDAIFSALH